jgi:hypothetical protein
MPAKRPRISSAVDSDGQTARGIPFPQRVPSGNDVHPAIKFEHANTGTHCLSKCQAPQIKRFVKLFQKVERMTWSQIIETGGSGLGKRGLSYEVVKDAKAVSFDVPDAASQGTMFKMQADGTGRLFGFRDAADRLNVLGFDRDKSALK